MHLLSNWRKILWRAWSVRLMLLAAILSAIEVALPLMQAFAPIPAGLFAALSAIVTAAALCARLIAQKDFLEDRS